LVFESTLEAILEPKNTKKFGAQVDVFLLEYSFVTKIFVLIMEVFSIVYLKMTCQRNFRLFQDASGEQ